MAWGVFDRYEDEGYHDVAPVVDVGGETMMSWAHISGPGCPCKPQKENHPDGFPIWVHNDSDEPEEVVN